MHDRGDARVSCLEGTRQAPIDAFFEWVRDGVTLICWFSGPAGYGKSALSQSIAERCAREHILAATFFFLRGAGLRSDIKYLITTLAFQLSRSFSATKSTIESALREEERIDSQSTKDQLEKLIIRPLMELVGHQETPLVIIIDALDECNNHKTMQDFIGILTSVCSNHQLPVRFLVTSRAEDHINQAFSSAGTTATTSISLENFNASKDIKTYLQHMKAECSRARCRDVRRKCVISVHQCEGKLLTTSVP
ncbi:hypothetical protein FIBSPDRAFT_759082 [Athelia psychrophila]|uniref:Nephrocystin 3-like N-terminal domain-containing protein n=1 Tax=Athelia psychrophila TaxID=1759441 RepID=A0A165YX50_9AGAM|nr:hypothetical protein FIBSPDRAFT_759082 [Fibularhizoctonia sp. CBS 109695]